MLLGQRALCCQNWFGKHGDTISNVVEDSAQEHSICHQPQSSNLQHALMVSPEIGPTELCSSVLNLPEDKGPVKLRQRLERGNAHLVQRLLEEEVNTPI